MDLFDKIINTISPSHSNDRYIRLANEMKRKQSQLLDIQLQAESLTKKDIATWRAAWQMCLNPESPKRGQLLDIYRDCLIDNHLSGAIDQRKGRTLQKDFVILNAKGEEDLEAKKIFEKEWFSQFINLALDAKYWGHSLIQMGDIVSSTGQPMRFESCQLVPRRHVIPEYGVITAEPQDDPEKGYSYREGDIANWCIEVGEANNLGLLLKIAPQTLSKKNMLAYWDTFGELFGMPIRIGRTDSTDKGDWNKIAGTLKNMGAACYALVGKDTEIEIKETTRGDAFNVYDRRIDRANSEMSKAILGQTMTIDNGSSQSQSEVHLEVLKNLCASDAKEVKNVINDKLIPLMLIHGFPVQGCTFDWDNQTAYTPEQQRENERLVLQEYEVDPQYFIDKYKMPIIGKKSSSPTDGEDGDTTKNKKLVRPDDFFA